MSPSLAVGQQYVLIVEDDFSLREHYRAAFRDAGLDTVAVADGLSALRCVDAARPRALVLDLDLPRLSGLDVQQELRAHPDTQHIPIVVVSGTDTRRLKRDDFACILRKPVTADALITAVRRCLARPF